MPTFRADSTDTIFEQLGGNQGLTSPAVTSFAEDGNGYLWVGTQSGLQRWDGYHFWSYKAGVDGDSSIPDNFITVLFTDRKGQLWLGSNSGGLARFDATKNSFVRYSSGAGGPNRLHVYAITGDGGDGLWIGTDSGLDRLDPSTGQFSHVDLASGDERQPRASRVTALLRTPEGILWAGTERGLEKSTAETTADSFPISFQRVSLQDGKDTPVGVTSLLADHAGRLWVGTQHGAYVVDRTNPAPKGKTTGRIVEAAGPEHDLLADEWYLSIAQTSQGEIWLGTQDLGVLAVDPVTWTERRISHDQSLPTSLGDDRVGALFLGKQGILWAGTRRGVSYLDTSPRNVFTMLGAAGKGNSIHDTDVYAILPRQDGSVWLGLSRSGIDILGPDGRITGELRSHAGPGASSGAVLPQGAIGGLIEAGDGSVYICTQHGLFRASTVDAAGRTIKNRAGLISPRLTPVPLGSDASAEITQVISEAGALWIGSNNGLWLLDPRDGPGPAKRPMLQQPLTDGRVQLLQQGPGNTLWIGTQNGLNRLDLDTRAVERILPNPSDPAALGGALIASLLTDRKGRLWVGTFSGGISVMVGRDARGRPQFHRILEGLPDENIDMLLEAADGKIWASTDNGLAVIDPDTFQVQALGQAEGVYISTYWNGVGGITASGELLFGGMGGMTIVHPEAQQLSTYQPPIVVTHAQIGQNSIPTGRFNGGTEETPIWIAPDHDDMTVQFAALDYSAPERNHYEYKLVGYDHDWIVADPTQRVARYTNLPPGNYTLMLRGSNRDGVWAPAREVRIHVLPAWYQKAWFRVLVVIATILLLACIFLLATAYLRGRQRALERQVTLRTRELEQKTIELKESQLKLEHIAYTDSLTGLPNRRMFTESFRQLLALKRRQRGIFALLLIDFDDFKEINDTYGHDAGDEVLKEMARRMNAMVRESDCLARLGGDEFGLLLGHSPDIEATEMVCRKIVETFAEPVYFEDLELKTAPSVGVAMYPEDGRTQDTLLKMADMAMYQAKRSGGNGCRWNNRAAWPAHIQ